MKALLTVLVFSTAALACTRIIERPAPAAPSVVTTPAISERVIERGAAAGASSAPACTWAGQPTSSGGISCQDHSQYRCNNGTWERTALSC